MAFVSYIKYSSWENITKSIFNYVGGMHNDQGSSVQSIAVTTQEDTPTLEVDKLMGSIKFCLGSRYLHDIASNYKKNSH